jgi:hypothetical protein
MLKKWLIRYNRSGEITPFYSSAKTQEEVLRTTRRKMMEKYEITYAKAKELDYEIILIK